MSINKLSIPVKKQTCLGILSSEDQLLRFVSILSGFYAHSGQENEKFLVA